MSNLDEFISAISGESYSSNSTSRAETAESVISSFVESLEDANTFEKIDALNRYKVQVNPYFPENTYAFNYIDYGEEKVQPGELSLGKFQEYNCEEIINKMKQENDKSSIS